MCINKEEGQFVIGGWCGGVAFFWDYCYSDYMLYVWKIETKMLASK